MTTDGSDAELITRVRAGDRAAFGTLYARHSQAATNLARQFARTPAEVDDLVSESFARVLDALLGGRGPATAFRAYLFTTLRNTAFDRTRKDSKLQFTDDVAVHETPETPDDPVVLELENTLVAKAFASLPERWQVVLWHTQVERQSPAEVGVLLGMSANAVTSLAFRAREGLREAYLRAHLADTAAERCRTTVDRLGAWVRGGLSKREQAQVDAHLDECDRCRALAAELTEINSGLRAILAPLLLGGAAAGYLATTSTGVAVPLVAAGAAGGGAAVGAGAAAGSGSSGGVWSFLARPWTLAAGGAGVAAAAAVAIVVAVTGNSSPAAAPPLVTPVTQTSVASTPQTTPSPSSASTPPSPSQTSTSQSSSAAPVVPPVISRPSSRVTPTTSSASSPSTTREQAPVVVHTTVGTPPAARPSSTPPATRPSSTPQISSTPASSSSTPTSSTTPTSAAPAPAELSAPQFNSTSLSATAGAPSTVTFSVTNSGATASDPQSVGISTPDGVSVAGGSGATSSQAPALRGFSALLPAPWAAGAGPVACQRTSCSYTVPANSVLTVTLQLTVDPDAKSGSITLTVPHSSPVSLPITVAPGLTDLRFVDPSGAWQAGTTVTTALQATVAEDVTDPGTVTLPLHNDDLWITDYPSNCKPSGTAAITCTAVTVAKRVADFGSLSVTLLPNATGAQSVQTTLSGGQEVPIVGTDGTAIVAEALQPGGPISITGFDGAIIGAAAQYCDAVDRLYCINHQGLGNAGWRPFDQSTSLPDAVAGKKIVLARLSWSVSFPNAASSTKVPDAATVTLDAGTPVHVQGTQVDIEQDASSRDARIVQYTADLPDPTVLAGHHSVSIAGIVPTIPENEHANGHAHGHDEHPAMVAWTLAIVWSDPDSNDTLRLYSTPTLLDGTGSSDNDSWTEPDASSGPLDHLSAAMWGVDGLGSKTVAAGGVDLSRSLPALGPLLGSNCSPLMGLIPAPLGSHSCASVGFGLFDADSSQVPSGSDGTGPITVTSFSDTIWVSSVLVVRSSAGD